MARFIHYLPIGAVGFVSLVAVVCAGLSVSGPAGVTAGGLSLVLTGLVGGMVAMHLLSVEARLGRVAGGNQSTGGPGAEPGAAVDPPKAAGH